MPNYALVDKNGVVQNVIVWDGEDAFDTGGLSIVPLNNKQAWIGGTWNGESFIPPVEE